MCSRSSQKISDEKFLALNHDPVTQHHVRVHMSLGPGTGPAPTLAAGRRSAVTDHSFTALQSLSITRREDVSNKTVGMILDASVYHINLRLEFSRIRQNRLVAAPHVPYGKNSRHQRT
jgi:hypothetical protein